MHKKKLFQRFTAIFAALLMIISTLTPAEGVSADDHGEHDYEWTGWENNEFQPASSGKYYLLNDITLSDTWYLSGCIDVTVCLNGHTLRLADGVTGKSVINITPGSKLTICDCQGEGKITGCHNSEGSGCIVVSGELILEGGAITGNKAKQGAGVDIQPDGTFFLKGGTISGNTASTMGAGVCVAGAGASFEMDNGRITENILDDDNGIGAGVSLYVGSFTMNGGEISENKSTKTGSAGGGVYVGADTSFSMFDGTISGNEVMTKGAGVCVEGDNASFEMRGGEIKDNKIQGDWGTGAGVSVNGEDASFMMEDGIISNNKLNGAHSEGVGVDLREGTFTMNGGEISENIGVTESAGGGVCVSADTSFVMNRGKIYGNAADSAGGVFVAGGSFTLNGGTIKSNMAYEGGGIFNQGTLAITGGEIKDNKASGGNAWGGGVYNYEGYSMTMSGGSISGNEAHFGAGIFLRGTLTVGGTAVISGNINDSDEANNVWWGNTRSYYDNPDDKQLILGTKTPEDEGNGVPVPATSMKVGVSLEYTPVFDYGGIYYFDWPIIRDNANLVTSANIVPDDSECGIMIRDNAVYLAHSAYFIDDGQLALEETEANTQASLSFLSDFEDVSFDGWYTQRTGGEPVSKDGVTFEAPYTGFEKGALYYAHWTYKGKPILTEPVYLSDGKVIIGGEEATAELLEQYNLSFDPTTLTLTADGAVMMVNLELIYKYVERDDDDICFAAAVNIASEDAANASTFVMKGDTYIACSGWGGIYDGITSGYGGGVYVGQNGNFIMESGTVKDNISYAYDRYFGGCPGAGAGVFLDNGGRACMNGGTICCDIPMDGALPYPEDGGGVYISDGAFFEMTGGNIEGCIAENGGGVYVANGGSFTMTDGLIRNNIAYAKGAGVFINNNAYVSISGGKIVDNGAEKDGRIYPLYYGGGIYRVDNADSVSDYSSCLAAGTMITMADGSHKAIETLKAGDEVRVFDHETGTETTSKIHVVYEYPELKAGAFTLHFSGDHNVCVVGGHLFYEQETNGYALIENLNAEEFVGHHFYNLDDKCWEVLESVSYSREPVKTLFIATEKQINCITDGMLSNEDGLFGVLCRIFDYDENMKFDEEKKSADIEKYGLFGASEAEYATLEAYEALNLKYLNIAVGKGLISAKELKEQGAYYSAKRQELEDSKNDGSFTKIMNVSAPRGLLLGAPEPEPGLYIGGSTVITNNLNGDVEIADPLTIGTGDNGCAAPTDGMKVNVYLKTNEYDSIGAFTTNGQAEYVKYFFPDPEMREYIYTEFVTDHLEFVAIPENIYPIIINYNENGTVTADRQIAEFGDEVTLTAVPNPGYVLESYSVVMDDSFDTPITVTDGKFFMTKDYSVIVTAFFTKTYTVSFDMNGHGTAISALENVTEGSTITLPTPGRVSGYEFKGWFTDAGCTISWVEDTDTVTDDTTLYAKWDAAKPTPGPNPNPNPTPEPTPEPTPAPKDEDKPETTEEYKVSVESDEDAVQVSAEITDGIAAVEEIDEALLKDLFAKDTSDTEDEPDAADKPDAIVINLSGAEQTVEGVELTRKTLKNLADIVNDSNYTADSVVVVMGGATVELDAQTLETIRDTMTGDTIKLVVARNADEGLNRAQKNTLGKYDVTVAFDVYLESNGVRIHDFKGGKVTVSIEFTPEKGKKARNYKVYYIADDGKLQKYATKYEDGRLTFITSHFSNYVVIYDAVQDVLLTEAATTKKGYIKLSWNEIEGAVKYVVYGAKCGKSYKELTETDGTSFTVKKISGAKPASGTTYKLYVVAYDALGNAIKSKTIHYIAGDTSAKYANVETITALQKTIELTVGEKVTVGAEYTMYEGKKHTPKKHGKALRFTSNCTEIAKVSSSGTVTAKSEGTAVIYIQDISGKWCRVEVTVTEK